MEVSTTGRWRAMISGRTKPVAISMKLSTIGFGAFGFRRHQDPTREAEGESKPLCLLSKSDRVCLEQPDP